MHDWRGRGIGQMLLAEAERLTREAGCSASPSAALSPTSGRERTYRDFGFEPYVSIWRRRV